MRHDPSGDSSLLTKCLSGRIREVLERHSLTRRKLASSPLRVQCRVLYMKCRSRQLFVPLICIFAIVQSLTAQEANADKPKQFVYVLRLVPLFDAVSACPNEDDAVLKL